ncbi:hypothetical protein ABPG74_011219 [Tetrahymena malaccensis]
MENLQIELIQSNGNTKKQHLLEKELSTLGVLLRIIYISVAFILVFSANFTYQALSSQIYDQQQFTYLGNISLFTFFLFESLNCTLTKHLQQFFTYRQMMWVSAAAITINVSTGMWVQTCSDQINQCLLCNKSLLYCFFILVAAITGSVEGQMWVSVSGYIDIYCKKYPEKNELYFSTFFGVFQLVLVFGMGFAQISFYTTSLFAFYFGLALFAFVGFLMIFYLPEMMPENINQQQVEQVGLVKIIFSQETKKSVLHFLQYLKNDKTKQIFLFFIQSGFTVGFIMTLLYPSIQKSLGMPLDSSLLTEEQAKELNIKTTQVQLLLGFTEIAFYFFLGYVEKIIQGKYIIYLSFFSLWSSLFCIGLTYAIESVFLCYLSGFLWGLADCIYLNKSYSICTYLLDGTIESYSLFNFCYGLGILSMVLLNIFIMPISFHLLLIILLCISLISYKHIKPLLQ